MTSSKPSSSPDDHVGLLIGAIVVGVAVLFAGPVPLIIAVAVIVSGSVFGVRGTALVALALVPVTAWIAHHSGQTIAYLIGLARLFWSDLVQPDWAYVIMWDWFGALADPVAWKITSPVGLLGGAVFTLLREDRRNSPEAQVTGRGRQRGPSLWARVRSWTVLTGFMAGVTEPLRGRHNAITLGADIQTGRRVQIQLNELSRHVVVVGRSGRGKTETLLTIVRGAAGIGMPIVYLDGKGDPAVRAALARLANSSGRPFYSLDAMRPDESCWYDAFAFKNPTTCTDMLVALRPEWSEAHYKSAASAHALTVFKTLAAARIRPDLHQIKRYLSVRSMLQLARRSEDRRGNHQALVDEIMGRKSNEKAAVESLSSEIALLSDAVFGGCFDLRAAEAHRPILRLRKAREQSAVVYIGLPALSFPDASARLASLVIGDLRATLPVANTRWLLVLDEFSTFATNNHVLNLINMGRSFGGCVVLATQTFGDVSAVSDAFLQQVVGSVNTFIIHELTAPEDAEYAASIIGTQQGVDFTSQIVNHVMTGSASARSVHNFRVHPDQIKHLDVGEAFAFNKDRPESLSRVKIKRAEIE